MANWIDRKFPAIFPLACLLILAVCHFVFAAGSRQLHKTETVTVWVNDSGDTAFSIKVVPTSGIDSFTYKDTAILGNGVVDSVYWISHPTTYYLVPNDDTNGVYTCSLWTQASSGADTAAFTYTCPESTAANVVRAMIDSLKLMTTIKDSIVVDSSANGDTIIIKAKKSQETFLQDARIVCVVGVSGTGATLGIDSSFTTVEMVCDSMAAKWNANALLSPYVTAESQDTCYVLTMDKKGLAMTLIMRDTTHDGTADTTTIQANVQGKTIQYDTLDLIQLITDQRRVGGIYGDIIIKPSEDTGKGGLGNSDSAYLYFGVRRIFDTGTSYTFIYKDSANALPCTLHFALPYAAANDTILKPIACLMWGVSDTCSDTNYAAEYDISIDILVLDQ